MPILIAILAVLYNVWRSRLVQWLIRATLIILVAIFLHSVLVRFPAYRQAEAFIGQAFDSLGRQISGEGAAPATPNPASPAAKPTAGASAGASPSPSAAPKPAATPNIQLPSIGGKTLVGGNESDWFRVVQDGPRLVQDAIRAEETADRPAYETGFVIPPNMSGQMSFKGIRCFLFKGDSGTPLVARSNDFPLTVAPGEKYRVSCEAGNNNSISLDPPRSVDKAGNDPTKPRIISDKEDYCRVVAEPDGRIWQDQMREGVAGCTNQVNVPDNLANPGKRIFQGVSASIWSEDGKTKLVGPGRNLEFNVKAGDKYRIVGNAPNPGMALEMPKAA